MIVAESLRGRRLVGRLFRGTEIKEGLLEVCRRHGVRAGEVRAIGMLDGVTLVSYDPRARRWRPGRHFEDAFRIVSLSGNISLAEGGLALHLEVSVSRERDNGVEVLGGHLEAGRVFAVEFVVDAFDDLVLHRETDGDTGLALWSAPVVSQSRDEEAPAAASEPRFEAPAQVKWEHVVAASQRNPQPAPAPEPEPHGDEEVRVAPGDIIEHPKFGRCQVERVEGDYEFVSARLRNQRLIRLSLDVIRLRLAGSEGERRLFRAIVET